MGIKDILKAKLFEGIQIRFSTGRPFDPSEQVRTDAVKDLVKADNKRREDADTRRVEKV